MNNDSKMGTVKINEYKTTHGSIHTWSCLESPVSSDRTVRWSHKSRGIVMALDGPSNQYALPIVLWFSANNIVPVAF